MTKLGQIKLNIIWIDKCYDICISSKDLGKYEYLSGQDLGYKLDVIQRAKFEYSPLGEAFSKVFERDDKNKKVIKYSNDLVFSSVYNFNKYSLPNFIETSAIDT